MRIKKSQKKYLAFILMISGLLIAYICINFSNGWIFVKINNKTYVANSSKRYKEIEGNQIGVTHYNQIDFLKPTRNNGSNILPYGCIFYEGEEDNEIFMKVKDQYIKLVSIENKEWKNGDKVTLADLELIKIDE